MESRILIFGATALLLVGCETSPDYTLTDTAQNGFIKKFNPAAVLDGESVEMGGIVKIQKVDETVIKAPVFGKATQKNREIIIHEGPRHITLQCSYNRNGEILVYEAELEIAVNAGIHYYPVAGMEINAGKTWMWIQNLENNERVSDRVEAELVKSFRPAEEDFMDIVEYASVIDPEVLEERRAICDNPMAAGYAVDESMDRGDLAFEDRVEY